MGASELCYLTATELAREMATGRVSAVEVVSAHLERIELVDSVLNAIVTLVPEQALHAARAADSARARGDTLGLLHGLPVGIKDLVDTAGIRTTYGSPIFRDHVPTADALIVTRLKRAGGIVIGKTNTPEFGAGAQTFNPVFGATRNPYDTSRTPAGSSGGAAVALASGMVSLANGTDMGGSLRHPASFCNVVGLRPSPGRIPDLPARDAWDPMTVSGPMARTVGDAALMLDAICRPDVRLPLSLSGPDRGFTAGLTGGVRGTRVAWSRTLGGLPVEAAVTSVLEKQRGVLEGLGCTVEDAEPDLSGVDEVFDVLRGLSFVGAHHENLQSHRELLKDTIVWNVEAGLALTSERIARAQATRTEIFHRMIEFLDRYDALVLPVSQVLPFPVEIEWVRQIGDQSLETYLDWQRSCTRITVTAHPAISIPGGFTEDGLPVGLQIVGRYRDESGLLRLAHAFEEATRFGERRPNL